MTSKDSRCPGHSERPSTGPAPGSRRSAQRGGNLAAGFTIAEAVVALGLTLMVSASFSLLFRQARLSLELQPELATLRQDGRAILDRIAADLARAGGGLPAEIPVFTDLDRAGDRDPDGLDFLTAPPRLADASFEPVVAFDGAEARLESPESRLARGSAATGERFVVVFNDDEMTPRWAFGQVVSVRGAAPGSGTGVVGAIRAAAQITDSGPGGAKPPGAAVRIAPRQNPWHWHFRSSVDADTFEPGSGGGLLERGLQSVLGGAIEAAVPGIGRGALASLTEQVVGAMMERLLKKQGVPVGTPVESEPAEGYGLFGLGQPGLVPVTRIRYWVRDPEPNAEDSRRVLMRRVDEEAPQPVGYVDDLQVRYVTGQDGGVLLDLPPRFIGDMASAARLRHHVVRAVDVTVRIRAPEQRGSAGSSGAGRAPRGEGDGFLARTYQRRVVLRVPAAGVERRAWEELMQLHSLPTEIPRIGPLRFLPVPW
ncbi:MAG: hypothetical protein OXE58_07290 [Acidobacteria bacterium]|nr:hypothetical protein [Acidobacteriota bacterium]